MAAAFKFRPYPARTAVALFAGAVCVLTAVPWLGAQTPPTSSAGQKPCQPGPTKPCPASTSAPAPAPSASEQFPYPGDPAPSAPQPRSSNPSASPPDAPIPSSPAPSSAKQFPYPGESTPSASDSSSSSSASSSSPDPDNPPPPDPDAIPTTAKSGRRKLPKVRDLQTDEEREAEDITVARFYRDHGNWNAAYLRSKDAVQHQPSDPDAHLLLAESAQKLNKRDEAIAEYNAMLKLDASEDQIKAAHKALARLQ